jgi:hypothetical protein
MSAGHLVVAHGSRKGPRISTVSLDGARLHHIELPARPIPNGLAVAYGTIYVSMSDGTVLGFGDGPIVAVWDRGTAVAGGRVSGAFDRAVQPASPQRGRTSAATGTIPHVRPRGPLPVGEGRADEEPAARHGLLREYWAGVWTDGSMLDNLRKFDYYPDGPTARQILDATAAPADFADRYGQRMRGFLTPPRTGLYTFELDTDDEAELLVSTDELAHNAEVIARASRAQPDTAACDTSIGPTASVHLEAGLPYYIEVLHVHGTGLDRCNVLWHGPGVARSVIARKYLSWSRDLISRR